MNERENKIIIDEEYSLAQYRQICRFKTKTYESVENIESVIGGELDNLLTKFEVDIDEKM